MITDLPPWVGSVDATALSRLLDLQSEHDWLDYKRQCDLSSTRDLVELTKDVGAMMISGGYIVVGADDRGQPAGEIEHLDQFDPAALHDKLAKYLPKPFEIRAAIHTYRGQSYALIYVLPHPDGLCIFERDGRYPDGDKQVTVFRAGDAFARHGTRSERWNQRDIAVVKERLRADANRGRDQKSEALGLLQSVPAQLGGSGLWLGVAVVPEHPVSSLAMISPKSAQRFFRDWQASQAPIEHMAQDTATYRQPGSVVITSQGSIAESPWWWRLALHDAGQGVAAHVLEQEVASPTDDRRWRGLPHSILDGRTIPVRRDLTEVQLLTLLDVLTAHATEVGTGGWALVTAAFLAPVTDTWKYIGLINELVDDNGERQGWRLASARAHQLRGDVVMLPVVQRVRLADMRDPVMRLQAAHRLAADLLALFVVDQPSVVKDDGTLDPYGAATDHQQLVYQHARHLGLPVDPVSPGDRRRQFEEEMRAPKERLRQR